MIPNEEDIEEAEGAISSNFPFISLYLFILIIFIILSRLSFENGAKDEIHNFISSMKFYNFSKEKKDNVRFSKENNIYHSNKLDDHNMRFAEVRTISHLYESKNYNLDDIYQKNGEFVEPFLEDLNKIYEIANREGNEKYKIEFSFCCQNSLNISAKIADFSMKILEKNYKNFLVNVGSEPNIISDLKSDVIDEISENDERVKGAKNSLKIMLKRW